MSKETLKRRVERQGRVFGNNYKRHMYKTKMGWNQGREVRMVWVGASVGG